MKPAWTLLALIAALCACSSPPPEPDAAAFDPPNLVFLVIDDLGWMDTGVYGSTFYETPNIDALAAGGMLFTDAYAASPVCSPTRAALLTGKFPWRTGILKAFRFGDPGRAQVRIPRSGPADLKVLEPVGVNFLPQEEMTLAEVLRDAGYTTAHIGKWHLGSVGVSGPEEHGYDLNVGGDEGGVQSHLPSRLEPSSSAVPRRRYLTDQLTEEAIHFLENHHDRPFLLSFWHYAVHTPLQAPQRLVDKYETKLEKLRANGMEPSQNNPVYAAMVEKVDESVGRIVATLDQLGLLENTLIVLTSDNGGHSRERNRQSVTDNAPLRGSKATLYEGGVRKPLILHWPREIAAGSSSRVPVSTIDLYPTALAAAGLEVPAEQEIDGLSLLPLLRGESVRRSHLVWHYTRFNYASSVRRGPWKLIRFHFAEEDGSHRYELYNLRKDLGETRNLAKIDLERTRRMKSLLMHSLRAGEAPMPRLNPNWIGP